MLRLAAVLHLGELFERALAKAGVQPARSVFIDNDHENVAVAAGCGMHAIHFEHASNDDAALAARLRNDFGLPA